jgi:tetratricopeptide (TPR) repeat protein
LDEVAQRIRVVEVVGEPGIGKSRLIHEFRTRLTEKRFFVLSGSCGPNGGQTPFLPFIDVVRGSFRVSEGEAEVEITRKRNKGLAVLGLATEQNVGLLLNLLGLKYSEESLRGLDGVLIGLRTRDLLLNLLRERCRMVPVIMIVEDLHWIDSASVELLSRLIAEGARLPLLFVLTHRPEYQPVWISQYDITVVKLEPLSSIDTLHIARSRLGVTNLPDTLARMVSDKAEGNPLFAEEIVSHLVERRIVRVTANQIEYDEKALTAALPDSIQSLLAARVDRLPGEHRTLLQAASVIGRRFAPDVLAAIAFASNKNDVKGTLSAIQQLDLVRLEVTGEFSFKHALVQDAIYNSLLQQSRADLHSKIAEVIEKRSHNRLLEVAELLAYHYEKTDRHSKSFRYLVMAGEKSLGIYSLGEAERYFERAIALIQANPECANDHDLVGSLASISYVLLMTFQPGKLVRLINHYRSRIEAIGDTPPAVIILTNYCFNSVMMCQYQHALDAAKQALDMAVNLNDDRSKAYARAAILFANSQLGQGDFEYTQGLAQLGAVESDRTNDAYVQSWVRLAGAWDCLYRGLTDRGRVLALELQERGRKMNDPRAAAMGLWVLGWLDIIDERYEEAILHGSECMQVSLTPFDLEIGCQVQAVGMIGCGRVSEGAALLRAHRERAIKNDFLYCTVGIDGPFGIVMVLQGDFSGGVRFIEDSIARHDREGNSVGRDLARIFLAETYLEFLAAKQRPSFVILIRNLPFLIVTALSGWKKTLNILLSARQNGVFSSDSHYMARIDVNLGLLYKIAKRSDEARKYLMQARLVAEPLKAAALLKKIDTALAALN